MIDETKVGEYILEKCLQKTGKIAASALLGIAIGYFAKDVIAMVNKSPDYTTQGVKVIKRRIGNENSRKYDIHLMEINDRIWYVPKADKYGNLISICKLEKQITKFSGDAEEKDTFFEGIEYKLIEGNKIQINVKTLEE